MNSEDASHLVEWSHVGVKYTVLVYTAILFTWSHFTLVGDFGEGLFHVSFWFALELVFIVSCTLAIGYGPSMLQGRLEVDTTRNILASKWCTFLALCMAAKNITHVGFVAAELNAYETMLAVNYYWFLVVFLVLLLLLMILDFVLVFYFYHYRAILKIYANTHLPHSKKIP